MLDKMTGLTSLLFMLWFGTAVSRVVDLQKRIVGGRDCAPQEHDYHVKLTDVDGRLICGGSLISQWWVLTAAHCWVWGMKVFLGAHPGPGQMMMINEPPLIYMVNGIYHDIMLLKLPKRTLRRHIDFAPHNCLSPPLGAVLETAGLASMTTGPNYEIEKNEAINLQCGNVTVTNATTVWIGLTGQRYSARVFFTESYPVEVSSGDSGGGVEYQNAIYGLNTAGLDTDFAFFGENYFLDVCYYRDWINETMMNYRNLFG